MDDILEKLKRAHAAFMSLTLEQRREKADKSQWETCAGCGKSEKEYFIETGYSMLVWHPKPNFMLCEDCYGDYDDEE